MANAQRVNEGLEPEDGARPLEGGQIASALGRPPTPSRPSQPSDPALQTVPVSHGFRSVLRNRYFLRLWLAQLISQTIQNAANYGLIILIAELTGSSTLIGLAIIS